MRYLGSSYVLGTKSKETLWKSSKLRASSIVDDLVALATIASLRYVRNVWDVQLFSEVDR